MSFEFLLVDDPYLAFPDALFLFADDLVEIDPVPHPLVILAVAVPAEAVGDPALQVEIPAQDKSGGHVIDIQKRLGAGIRGAFDGGGLSLFGIKGIRIINDGGRQQKDTKPAQMSHAYILPKYLRICHSLPLLDFKSSAKIAKMSVKENLQHVRQRIEKAALSIGRDPNQIKLIGAVKNVPTELVVPALEAGLTDLGENRVQEARLRFDEIRARFPKVAWHMIGHLQRNKVGQALDIFDIIQSVDSERLASEIQARAQAQARVVPILIEINTSGEATKYGLPIDATVDFLKKIANFGNIRVQGLMTIGLFTGDLEKVRPCFAKLRGLSEEIKKLNLPRVEMKYLSMGMTDDFEVAIEEGSNMLRIGRAIFGERRG